MSASLNHNHLYYFWLAAKHRNLSRAARELGLSQPTVSAQIRSLEGQLKTTLLIRSGRAIELTEAGMIVFRHADEMFQISSEIPDALGGRQSRRPRPLHVGTSDFVPKPIIRRILEPLLKADPELRLVCREWRIDALLAELAIFQLDLVIAERPHPDTSNVRAVSHPIMETPLAVYATRALAGQLRRGFPQSLHGAPMYLPVSGTTLRESMDRWFESLKIEPRILGEFEDRELLKSFGGGGLGAFPAAALIEDEVKAQFRVERVGWIKGVRETYYAITVRRRAMHPAVNRVLAAAEPAETGTTARRAVAKR
ncbi:MAG: LysR family transcriptional regulator [Phycisphaerales bacterium]|nr:LysR family transcriptional regulator [Phycisphaerales bacterium]